MTRAKRRLVRGLRLVSTLPGFWKLEDDPSVLFQYIGKARLGHPGSRYSVDRWLSPNGAVTSSLDSAVKSYLAKSAPSPRLHSTTKVVTISVHENEDEDAGEESYTISDDGGEFDDVEEDRTNVQGAIDDRRLHYRSMGLRAVVDAPARMDLR